MRCNFEHLSRNKEASPTGKRPGDVGKHCDELRYQPAFLWFAVYDSFQICICVLNVIILFFPHSFIKFSNGKIIHASLKLNHNHSKDLAGSFCMAPLWLGGLRGKKSTPSIGWEVPV
jgi:hypothetical protein